MRIDKMTATKAPDNRWRRAGICMVWMLIAAGAMLPAQAQEVSVEASVNETTVGTEEVVTYTIQINGVDFPDVESPSPPSVEGLVLLQPHPSTRRNISFVHGALSQSVAFQWNFRPVKEGSAKFFPTTVIVKGQARRTKEIRITVVSQSKRPQQNPQNLDPFAAFGFPQAGNQPERKSRIEAEDIFIRAIPSARQGYQNEQLIIEYQLLFRNYIQPHQSRLADSWDAEGFWREELEVDTRPMPRAITYNGLRYNSIVLKRVAVFPTHNGKLTIDPLRIETEVFAPRRGGADPFGQFFSLSSPYEIIERDSPPITIEALPLPGNAPASFSGAVGKFEMTAQIDQSEVAVGESIQVKVRLSGTGNLALLEGPTLNTPGVFEVYDPEVNLVNNNTRQRVQGSKTFTYILVPRTNGTFEIPPIEFAYFDPEVKRYEVLRSEPLPIRVTGDGSASLATSTTNDNLPIDDIAPLQVVARWQQRGAQQLHQMPWTYALLSVPLLALGLLFGYRRHTNRLTSDVAYARNRRAHPLAKKHLKQAEALQKTGDYRLFYEEIERAVLGFIGNRLNVAEQGRTRHQLDELLAASQIAKTIRADLHGLLEQCDEARFAPIPPSEIQIEADLDLARKLIIDLNTAFTEATAPAS